MFNCVAVESRLCDYIEGSLSLEDRSFVAAHLESCGPCSRVRDGIVEVREWAHGFPLVSPPEHLVSRVLARTPGAPPLICAQVEQRLSEYLDGQIRDGERALIAEHLVACRSCDDRYAEMVGTVQWSRSAPSYSPPAWLVPQILANTPQNQIDPIPSCSSVRAKLCELIDGLLSGDEALVVTAHISECVSCCELRNSMSAVVRWGSRFPEYDVPAWLPARILAVARPTREIGVPDRIRETWTETLARMGAWMLEPRTAMAVFTAVLVLGWMSGMAGVSTERVALANPSAMYYSVEKLADDMYDRSVRLYYGVGHTLLGEIQVRIERLRETS